MRAAGIDIGSRTVKFVVMENREIVHEAIAYNSHDPISVARSLLQECPFDRLTATGYGRHLISRTLGCEVATEIRAAAIGTAVMVPTGRTIIDIGGQDIKVISTGENGEVRRFEMNDKCAAGTGRFLEIMAAALSLSMSEFIQLAQTAVQPVRITSMCTVFAESEVVSQLARGCARDELALGIHHAIAQRIAGMAQRTSLTETIVVCGGVARNATLIRELTRVLGLPVVTPDRAQLIPAIGAAMLSHPE